jgi:Leucine-rich repeat (LRR) protein
VLDLHLAEIAAVPSQVGALASVVELDLSQNHLTRWPEPVLAMPALERLDLSSNRIARVPETAGALRLTALDLGRNRMRHFPMAVLNIATLVELDVSNSQDYVDDEARITGLPEQIGALQRLERFSYRFQIIEAFPDALFALPRLAELDLMMCTLPEAIPSRLAELAALTQLDLRYSTWASRAPAIRKLLPGCKVLAAS